ncbi:acyl-CoA dehydrogenase family protein [Aquamicrobium sp. LC103]|uniref:acyl-CoA dehydrogenase family protein n=1 Tax=Aquamicrobium sp. LC103 TaxID=1120658 RepID=UPI00063E87E5|nr:acyl-CoA dehydrogenase family protein [Aquamicrobium sp. LC103]TKT69788.1 acyl-CoA dehydrogenase [Aquamicrobium sp. LC103]
MNFQQSLEQDMLRSSVAATFDRDAAGRGDTALAELGIFGLLVAEANGGLGLGLAEAVVVLQEAGRAGLAGTLAETLLLADTIATAVPEQCEAVLAGGARVVAPLSGTLTRANGRLRGKVTIQHPRAGDWIVVGVDDDAEIVLLPASRFELAGRARIEAEADACEVNVDVPVADARLVRLQGFADRLAILRCAELLGAAEHCFTLSVGYMNERTQFGQAIGANQALKHIAADTYLSLENLRVAVEYAAAASDAADREDEEALCAAAVKAVQVMLAYVPNTAREIAETAIHLHGGIGLTWEYPLNVYVRRIVRLGTALGTASAHRLALYDGFSRSSKVGGKATPSSHLPRNGAHHDSAL